jgi:hypothetical protein
VFLPALSFRPLRAKKSIAAEEDQQLQSTSDHGQPLRIAVQAYRPARIGMNIRCAVAKKDCNRCKKRERQPKQGNSS